MHIARDVSLSVSQDPWKLLLLLHVTRRRKKSTLLCDVCHLSITFSLWLNWWVEAEGHPGDCSLWKGFTSKFSPQAVFVQISWHLPTLIMIFKVRLSTKLSAHSLFLGNKQNHPISNHLAIAITPGSWKVVWYKCSETLSSLKCTFMPCRRCFL